MNSLEAVREVLAKALSIPGEEIRPSDQLLGLQNMDSLVIEEVLLELEEQLDIELDFKSLLDVKTVSQLCDLIDEKGQ